MSSSDYSKFNSANPLTSDDIDPTFMCVNSGVSNTFFTKTGIPGSNMELNACLNFMGTRCSLNWDNMCEAYLTTSNTDSGGFTHLNKNFLAETAKRKYCQLASGAPGTSCATKCEAFLPEQQSSVNTCESVGTQNWLDTKDEYDLAGNFPQSARLNPISPLYMGPCPSTCDASNLQDPDALGPNDTVLNYCIANGTCEQILMDLAYNLVKLNKDDLVTNPAFKKIIDQAKLDRPINPNIAAKIATAYGIPPSVALDVLQEAKYGGPIEYKLAATPFSGSPPTFAPPPVLPSQVTKDVVSPVVDKDNKDKGVVSPTTKAVVSPKSKEGFYPPQAVSTSNILIGVGVVCAIIILAIICYLLYTHFTSKPESKTSSSYYF